MTDIEVKRKELETAKRIREKGCDGFIAICDGISCDGDNCPFVVLCSNGRGDEVTAGYVRAFISIREAELSQPEQSEVSRAGLAEALELSLAMYFRDPSVEEAKALNVIAARLQRDIDAERERQERILTGRA